eukprot:351280-Chlamydomonas_euryale.AAC.8
MQTEDATPTLESCNCRLAVACYRCRRQRGTFGHTVAYHPRLPAPSPVVPPRCRVPGTPLYSPNVVLLDEHASVVDGLGQTLLEDNGLQAALQEVVWLQRQHVIQLVLRLIQQTILVHAAHQSLALEKALRVVLVVLQQVARRVADLGQNHLHAPQLTLVAQAILAHKLQLAIKALLLEWAPRLLERLSICAASSVPRTARACD